MKRHASRIGAVAMSIFIASLWTIALLTFAPACGGTTRADTIHATFVAVDAASDGFATWNREVSKKILEEGKAKIPELGVEAARVETVARLDAHDKRVDDVIALFLATYKAGMLAARKSDDQSLKDAIKAASELFDAIAKVKEGRDVKDR